MHSWGFAQISALEFSPTYYCFPKFLQIPRGQEHLFSLGHLGFKPILVVQALACQEQHSLPLSVKQELIWGNYRIFSWTERPQISNGSNK